MNGGDGASQGWRGGTSAGDTHGSDFAVSSSMSVHTLPEGTRLLDYRITGLLGEGGFGIVYLAFDEALERRVALKEYLPSSIASRASGSMTVLVKSPRQQETFALGLKSFVNEAKLLARFDHPSLVKVHRFWEANDTAYMVMPYYEGPTLKRALAELGRPPDEAELRAWLRPLLDALSVLHAAHCFHRDIAPDNILLTAGGPVLLDFGAARRVIGDMTQALTVVLKPGFAPIEQYGESPHMTQGAWTDIYALAAVVYAAITGQRPAPSVTRLMDDRMQPLRETAAGRYSAPFLAAVDAALALRPQDRPQSIARFRALLDGRDEAVPAPVPASELPTVAPAPAPKPARVAPTAADPQRGPIGATADAAQRRRLVYALVGVAGLLGAGALGYRFAFDQGAETASASAPPAPAAVAPMPATFDAAPAASASVSAASAPAASVPAVERVQLPVAAPPPAPHADAPAVTPPAAPAGPRSRPDPRPPQRRSPPTVMAAPPGAPPADAAGTRAKCSDILQKGSLETLTASETEYLRRECQ